MSYEASGKLFRILQETTGSGANGPWTKREFVIETTGEYPKKIAVTAWNDKAVALGQMREGETIKVTFDVASREYNNKWYTDVRLIRMEKASGSSTNTSQQTENRNSSTTSSNTRQTPPPYTLNDAPPAATEEDDLPF